MKNQLIGAQFRSANSSSKLSCQSFFYVSSLINSVVHVWLPVHNWRIQQKQSLLSIHSLCLLNTMSKFLETLNTNRLLGELEQQGDLHEWQFEFRRNKSTIQAIDTIVQAANEYKAK